MAIKRWIGTDGNAATASNYDPSGVPSSSDDLYFPSGSGAITAGLTTLAGVALADVFVEPSAGAMGSILDYFSLNCDRLYYSGGGVSFIDFAGSAPAEVIVQATASTSTGVPGLSLASSAAVDELSILSGSVGLGVSHEYDFSATTLGVGLSSAVTLGHDSTAVTLHMHGRPTFINYGAISGTQFVNGGTYEMMSEQAQPGSWNLGGAATVYHDGPGTVGGTVYLKHPQCLWDATRAAGVSRTVTAIEGREGRVFFYKDYTIGNLPTSNLGSPGQSITFGNVA